MNTQNEKVAAPDRASIDLSRIFESFATSVDYETQDDFYCRPLSGNRSRCIICLIR